MMELERTKALYDEDMVTAVAENVMEVQALRFQAVFGRFPKKTEPIFFADGDGEPKPMPYPELLAVVVGHVLGERNLGLDRIEIARPFAILVLLRLGLPAAAAEDALRGAGRFVLH
jgi:hypothetical protein